MCYKSFKKVKHLGVGDKAGVKKVSAMLVHHPQRVGIVSSSRSIPDDVKDVRAKGSLMEAVGSPSSSHPAIDQSLQIFQAPYVVLVNQLKTGPIPNSPKKFSVNV